MPAADLGTTVSEFWEENDAWVSAAVALLVAFAVAFTVDRLLARRGRQIAETVLRGDISRQADTRLRFVRRLIYATILLLGVATALSQFTGLSKLATSVLASGALAAAIIGFAARQTLANVVAGIMLAITQPLRVGDWVTVEDNYGVVEDVRLNYTILRAPSDQRIVIPNERLATGILHNDTLAGDEVGVEASIWLSPEADVGRAVEVLREATGHDVAVAEMVPEGVRLVVTGDRVPPPQRGACEAELRAHALERLRAAGLLPA
jgi:small-conductance mechanosensitive channel